MNVFNAVVYIFIIVFQVNRPTKCEICTALKEEKKKATNKTLRAYYDNLYKHHNDLERYALINHRDTHLFPLETDD